jgi:galactose mutarotase-like enzyme
MNRIGLKNMSIELKNDKLCLEFNELGGALSSVKDSDGIEYLWQGNPDYWSSQAPVLFPICGSLRNDWAIYRPNEREHFTGIIPRHGLVRKKVFELEEQTSDSLTFLISSDEEMYKNYPYHFDLRIVYTLKESAIRTEYHITNHEDTKTMPFFIGGHPGFNCPLFEGEDYTDYYLEFEKMESCSIPKSFPETGLLDLYDRTDFLKNQQELQLSHELFSKDLITLDQLESRRVSLHSRKHDKGIQLDFQDFPYLVLWSTTNKGPFIALEPWSGLSTSLEESDYLEDKKNVSFVEHGQTSICFFDISIF